MTTIAISFDAFSFTIAVRTMDNNVEFIESRFSHYAAVLRWMAQLERHYHIRWEWTSYGDGTEEAVTVLPLGATIS